MVITCYAPCVIFLIQWNPPNLLLCCSKCLLWFCLSAADTAAAWDAAATTTSSRPSTSSCQSLGSVSFHSSAIAPTSAAISACEVGTAVLTEPSVEEESMDMVNVEAIEVGLPLNSVELVVAPVVLACLANVVAVVCIDEEASLLDEEEDKDETVML